MELEVGDIIMCTVDRIVGSIVFVKIDGTNKEGSITFSEVSPGRIRNIRDFVIPKKKIICKVLRLSGDHIGLSLRRVTPKEQKEIKLTTTNPKGLTIIKKLLDREDAEIKYISAGRYTIKTVANNLKDADKKQKEIQEEIEKETKKQGIEFQIK